MSWPDFWIRKDWKTYILWPLSKLVCWKAQRRLSRFKQMPPNKQVSAKVVVVGNIVVGGAGKTPFIIWLTQQLQAQGLRVGIVSRGYGGQSKTWPLAVTAESNPEMVGDEPVLLAKKLGCPVAVAPKRPQAISLLGKNHVLDVIISDDGLQHYAMARDVEVVLIDAQRQFGNQLCMPSGPLREPMARLAQVDFCIWNGLAEAQSFPTFDCNIDNLEKSVCSAFRMNLKPTYFCQVINPKKTCAIDAFKGQVANAIAGIGHPTRFFETLELLGVKSRGQAFADHHAYQLADFNNFSNQEPLLMTEKDAVKCKQFALSGYKCNWWYLEVTAICDKLLLKAILKHLEF